MSDNRYNLPITDSRLKDLLAIVSCLLFVLVAFALCVAYYVRKIAPAFGSIDSPISGDAGVAFLILLCLSGVLGAIIGSVAWIVAMKPFFGREEMRRLFVQRGKM